MSAAIIAEIASAHCGNLDLMVDLIDAAYYAGADGIKIQVWREPEIKDHKNYDNLKQFEFTDRQWLFISKYIKSLDLDLWVEVYGHLSYAMAIELNYDYAKASRTLLDTDPQFLTLISHFYQSNELQKGDNLYMSDSMFWRWTPSLTAHVKNMSVGEQDYPTSTEQGWQDVDLIKLLIKHHTRILFADHQDPKTDEAYTIPLAAVKAGADYIEKHICINREKLKLKSRDYLSAFEPDEFKRFVAFMSKKDKVVYLQ